ncbi:hypothetical protein DCO58_05115 [Helicobacter saguini]|uniref:PPM-type phosphatase domain-containing protein n=1 Tax=Helicobacter saguini TaxID=1548018 RepID=A0A347VT20_9HELI|nr:protein phosphatase 2C domain-containing protein [Helicobacter saguini]MWV62270.1 hypothetical protein [Helicobacter saguini]MWV67057.1 hypothetical protein [Helicobacter saguini]MWV69407.1 hypothetical protein [Helicobacter saguini]MWV71039.1 hypothetical protein [Helicobacter saguini]TLD95055.1 hypothetical protein LS64_003875 [Helicobacter saguini]
MSNKHRANKAYTDVQNNGNSFASPTNVKPMPTSSNKDSINKPSISSIKPTQAKGLDSKNTDSKLDFIESKDSKYEAITYESQGRSHVQKNTPCQDRAFGLIDSNIAIITLCDGAGSAKHSHFGADTTTKLVADLLKTNFDKYYTSENIDNVRQEIVESIVKNLESTADSKTKELKLQAGKNIQEILKNIASNLKIIDLTKLSFDCENAIRNEIKNIESKITTLKNDKVKKEDSIKDLERQKSENAKRDYLTRFEKNLQRSKYAYECKIKDATKIYRKVLKIANKDRGFIESIFNGVKNFFTHDKDKQDKDLQSVQTIQQNIKKKIDNDTQKLDSILNQLESKMQTLKNANAKKISEILNELENIGSEILDTLEDVYMNMDKYAKNLENQVKKYPHIIEDNSTQLHLHFIQTQKRFERLIQDFITTYKKCIDRQKGLIESAISDVEKEIKNIESNIDSNNTRKVELDTKIIENSRLKTELDSKKSEFNNAKNSVINDISTHSKKSEFDLKDIESIRLDSFKNAINSLEKTRKTCENLCKEFNADTKNLQNIPSLDIESSLDSIKKEIENSTCVLKDLASTLLFVAVKGEQCLIGHLGDGTIGALYGETLKVVSSGDNGEHANETYFVTTKGAARLLQITRGNVKEKNIKAFVLMSDGSSEGLLIKRENKFAPALENRIKSPKDSIKELIEKVKETKSFDDCSIAILRQKA